MWLTQKLNGQSGKAGGWADISTTPSSCQASSLVVAALERRVRPCQHATAGGSGTPPPGHSIRSGASRAPCMEDLTSPHALPYISLQGTEPTRSISGTVQGASGARKSWLPWVVVLCGVGGTGEDKRCALYIHPRHTCCMHRSGKTRDGS